MSGLRSIGQRLGIFSVSGMAAKLGFARPVSVRHIKVAIDQTPKVEHVFVLVLENRAFDHVLGFAGLTGRDAIGNPTRADDLIGNPQFNAWPDPDAHHFASQPADFKISLPNTDPKHEFDDVLLQLCGPGAAYPVSGTSKYPAINNSGFIESYRRSKAADPTSIMKCFAPEQVPVVLSLAKEFAVCDRWFASMPGPTWPNRFFLHAASSAGLDDSPSGLESAWAAVVNGFSFENGTIYERLREQGREWMVIQGDEFPQVRAIADMDDDRFHDFSKFEGLVNDPAFSASYTFIEPDYGNNLPINENDYTCGNSQHPVDDFTRGEKLIKSVYELIRNSPHWEKSLLLVTYDEHGGFFDHVHPPAATAPGDKFDKDNTAHAFDFTQLGVRVPAIIVSPWIPRGTIDHTIYDHTSLLATVEHLWGLRSLTNRDRDANTFLHLLTLDAPRTDAPVSLPNAAESGLECLDGDMVPVPPLGLTHVSSVPMSPAAVTGSVPSLASGSAGSPSSAIDPELRGFAHVALVRALKHAAEADKPALIRRFLDISTDHQALTFMKDLRPAIRVHFGLPAVRSDPLA